MLDKISYNVEYEPRQIVLMNDAERIAAASVWMDRILGMMGETPEDYARFGWFAEERAIIEDILQTGLALAKNAKPSRSPARILYRLTKADTPTSIMQHTVTISQNAARIVVVGWSAEIKEMG